MHSGGLLLLLEATLTLLIRFIKNFPNNPETIFLLTYYITKGLPLRCQPQKTVKSVTGHFNTNTCMILAVLTFHIIIPEYNTKLQKE